MSHIHRSNEYGNVVTIIRLICNISHEWRKIAALFFMLHIPPIPKIPMIFGYGGEIDLPREGLIMNFFSNSIQVSGAGGKASISPNKHCARYSMPCAFCILKPADSPRVKKSLSDESWKQNSFWYNRVATWQLQTKNQKEDIRMDDIKSLAQGK